MASEAKQILYWISPLRHRTCFWNKKKKKKREKKTVGNYEYRPSCCHFMVDSGFNFVGAKGSSAVGRAAHICKLNN